jgi:serine/threonine protein kinase
MPSCSKCHRDVAAGALFCASCGASVMPEQAEGAPFDPLIGQTFRGTYFIQQWIGGGGMGDVYKALHVTLDVPIALKILKKALLSDPAIVQRFHREARAASRLRHHNVIRVTDFGQIEDGTLYMAMEYVAGKSLARVIAEEFPLSEQRIVHVVQQVLSALSEAHASQILHRDLKPENVMLESRRSEPDLVKVLDFGIAKIQMPGDDSHATLTQVGLVCGTPGYMSPEQWSGEQLDARSDLYAVGVMLYELLTGKLPFEAQTPMELVRKHLTEKPLPPSARRDDHAVSADLEALVMRALSSDRENRPPSADAMRDDLLACVLLPEPALPAEQGDARRTVVLPPRISPAGAMPRQPATPAPGVPGRDEPAPRPPATQVLNGPAGRKTPASPPRQTEPRDLPSGAPRHELDDAAARSDEPAERRAPGPRPRSKRALLAGGVAVAVGLAAGVAHFAAAGRSPRTPQPVAGSVAAGQVGMAGLAAQLDAGAELAADAGSAAQASQPAADAGTVAQSETEGTGHSTEAKPDAGLPSVKEREDHGLIRKEREDRGRRPKAGRFEFRGKLNAFALPAQSSGMGILSVDADPSGDDVTVNGSSYGRTPKEILVPAGRYAVRVTRRNSEAASKQVVVYAGTRAPFTATFPEN